MAYVNFSNNPLRRNTGDCVIRAISVAERISWDDAFWLLAKKAFELADVMTSNATWSALLKELGYQRYVIPDKCPDCYSIEQFADDHRKGTFIVGTGTHAVAVVNGDYYDSWKSGDEIPMYYFKKER